LEDLRVLESANQLVLHKQQRSLTEKTATLNERIKRLESDREKEDDEKLEVKRKVLKSRVDATESEFERLNAELAQASPEATAARYKNAELVLERAKTEFTKIKERIAVLEDRLEQAQANGKHESLDIAQREVQERKTALARIQK